MRLLGRDQKGLNINSAELFSPPGLLQGTASQVQGSHRSPAERSVSITGTSHGAITRGAASYPLSLGPVATPNPFQPHTHAVYTLGAIQSRIHTCHCHCEPVSTGEADVCVSFFDRIFRNHTNMFLWMIKAS